MRLGNTSNVICEASFLTLFIMRFTKITNTLTKCLELSRRAKLA